MPSTLSENDVRLFVYRHFVSAQKAPSVEQTARALDVGLDQIQQAFQNLAEQHILVLKPDGEIHMAMPFSAVETDYKVKAGESSWWAN